jgi:ribose/xylose/arabinose/galactoside ABC-type transport system permease subunit
LGVGLLNGVLVAYGKVPSIIVTLGMMTVLKGGTLLLLKGEWVRNLPDGLRFLGTGSVFGVPFSVLVAVFVAVWAIWVAGRTKFGRRVYALGSNPKAAELVGLPTKRVKLAVFALTGLLTAVATLIGATKLQVVESGFGGGFEMVVVAAVVVGGTSIKGGRGTVLGTLFGATLLGIISTVLIFMKLGMQATYWEKAIQGAFILAAVLGDQLSRRREVSA